MSGERSPGPWRVNDDDALPQALANPHMYSWDVVDADGNTVCEAGSHLDAALIAAAPDLLKALRAVVGRLDDIEARPGDGLYAARALLTRLPKP